MTLFLLLRGLGVLVLLIGLALFWLTGFGLLVREPTPRRFRIFKLLAWLAVALALIDFLLPLGGLHTNGLHLLYGAVNGALLLFLSGLEPQGWFRRSLPHPPERVGVYLFWGSLIGTLMTLRFIATFTPSR
jgi:hypothetical protein